MNENIVVSIVAIVMLVLILKKGDRQAVFLTAGLTVGILIAWCGLFFTTIGLLFYMFTALLIAIFSLKNKELTKFNRLTIFLAGVFAFCSSLFSIMHWVGAREAGMGAIVLFVLFLVSLFRGMLGRQELSYLTILNAVFVWQIVRFFIAFGCVTSEDAGGGVERMVLLGEKHSQECWDLNGIPQGTFAYELYFAEFGGRMENRKCEVTIKGNKITVKQTENTNLTGGEYIFEGLVLKHKSGKWILAHDKNDANADEIGGCTEIPIIEFNKKQIEWC